MKHVPVLLIALGISVNGTPAWSQAPLAASSCIDVEVDGQRSVSMACLQEKLQEKMRQEAHRPKAANSESVVQNAPHQLGMPTPATLSNRMGNALGHSVRPQRPAAEPVPPPFLQR